MVMITFKVVIKDHPTCYLSHVEVELIGIDQNGIVQSYRDEIFCAEDEGERMEWARTLAERWRKEFVDKQLEEEKL